jgi:protein gp37
MAMAKRLGKSLFGHAVEWGPGGQRGYARDEKWKEPLTWNRDAQRAGERRRVFCGSMMDVFEGLRDQRPHLEHLWCVIEQTPHLDWLLLTKRPNNVRKLAPQKWPSNVWVGCTIENQEWADQRLPHLLSVDCAIRFVSVEPMLSPLDLRPHLGHGLGKLNWVIFGAESGAQARSPEGVVSWFRDLRDQCVEADVPVFHKQWGAFRQGGEQLIKLRPKEKPPKDAPVLLDGVAWQQFPR